MKLHLFLFFIFISTFLSAQGLFIDKNGMKQGKHIYIDQSRHLEIVIPYKDDQIHGAYIEREIGTKQIRKEIFYIDGVMNGIFRSYDPWYKIEQERMYFNGQLNGTIRHYIKGKISMEESYLHGKPSGRWNFYNRKGRIDSYFDCIDGVCGNIYFQDKNMRVYKEVIRGANGLRLKTNFYNKKGEITNIENHKEGMDN